MSNVDVKPGLKLPLTAAELAPVLKDHEFIMVIEGQRCITKVTGQLTDSGALEVVVTELKKPKLRRG